MNFYHTQDDRMHLLTEPILCVKDNAWLGEAYYFWEEESDADFWGNKFKNKTGKYNVYISDISMNNVLDTVFNREHYVFWIKQVEKVAKNFIKKTNSKPTLKKKKYGHRLMGFYFKIFHKILFILWLRNFSIRKEYN